jgi:transcriptional regulator GlxA family with amidase domain
VKTTSPGGLASRTITNCLNVSPQNYLINFRLKKACDLLSGTNLSINELSNSVGYGDPFLFSKVFKKYKGISPRAYRTSAS